MRGVSLMAVKELLGHESIEMTLRYSHLSRDVKRDAVKLLDRPSPSANGHLMQRSGTAEGRKEKAPGTQ
jgi:hypothetical protein